MKKVIVGGKLMYKNSTPDMVLHAAQLAVLECYAGGLAIRLYNKLQRIKYHLNKTAGYWYTLL